MLIRRDVCTCAWNTILLHGATQAEAAADARIAELRAQGCVAGADMWQAVREAIPELLADPDLWDDLPNDTELIVNPTI
jgi:hypothetical protein